MGSLLRINIEFSLVMLNLNKKMVGCYRKSMGERRLKRYGAFTNAARQEADEMHPGARRLSIGASPPCR